MRSTAYDPPQGEPQPPQYPQYPQYPGYQYPYPYQPPQPPQDNKKIIIIIVVVVIIIIIIPMIIAGLLYFWVSDLSSTEEYWSDSIIANLEQGPGNMTSGCLFTLQKGSGEPVKISDYRFKVGERGNSLYTLKWPDDGNTTYSIDSMLRTNDGEWWDATEVIGFDAPPGLTGVEDGDTLEVSIIFLGSSEVVYFGQFTYRD
jgi:FlaG/FlaF family flagellin (archaellin)